MCKRCFDAKENSKENSERLNLLKENTLLSTNTAPQQVGVIAEVTASHSPEAIGQNDSLTPELKHATDEAMAAHKNTTQAFVAVDHAGDEDSENDDPDINFEVRPEKLFRTNLNSDDHHSSDEQSIYDTGKKSSEPKQKSREETCDQLEGNKLFL